MKTLLPLLLLLCGSALTLRAQTTIASTTTLPSVELREVSADWDFFEDLENRAVYIDFRDVNQNLREIVVLNNAREVVFREDIHALPVDSIYELNYGEFLAGVYTVELRSYTSVMRREMEVE